MADDEGRREEARIDALIERALRNGTMGECACGEITSQIGEDPDTGEEYWVCKRCVKDVFETDIDRANKIIQLLEGQIRKLIDSRVDFMNSVQRPLIMPYQCPRCGCNLQEEYVPLWDAKENGPK